MLRPGIFALLICSQLTAPAMSGKFVCLAANGCVCVDAGPQTCACCKIQRKAPKSCSCGCREEQLPQRFEAGDQDCAHIAVGNYETPVKEQASTDALSQALPVGFAVCTPPVAVASLARCSFSDSATLAVISTVALRI